MAADTLTREAKIDRWVALDAAEIFFINLLHSLDETELGNRFGSVFPLDVDADITIRGQGELFNELWRGEDDDTPEMIAAGVRVDALVARAFAWLASDDVRMKLIHDVAYFSTLQLAVRDVAKVT